MVKSSSFNKLLCLFTLPSVQRAVSPCPWWYLNARRPALWWTLELWLHAWEHWATATRVPKLVSMSETWIQIPGVSLGKILNSLFFFELKYSWFTVLVSGVPCKYIHIHIYQIIFPWRLLQNTECSSLYWTVGPYWLSSFFIFIRIYLFTMLCYFLLYSKVNQLYVYTYPPFLDFLPI